MQEITVTAKTYDEAVTNALLQLQTTSDNVRIEVLETGSEGIFGLGAKPYVIKVSLPQEEDLMAEAAAAEAEEAAETAEEIETEAEDTPAAPVAVQETEEPADETEPEKAEELIAKAEKFLRDIFANMKMQVEIRSEFDKKENQMDVILSGDDMGVLIGKRGQTLDSIQYLTSLVVNKGEGKYCRVKLDTENYRERRQEKLEELARNIAHKVAKSRRAQSLEPMNPYERRIIHSALQNDPYVTTVSEGEEPYRHVVVMLKKNKKYGR